MRTDRMAMASNTYRSTQPPLRVGGRERGSPFETRVLADNRAAENQADNQAAARDFPGTHTAATWSHKKRGANSGREVGSTSAWRVRVQA